MSPRNSIASGRNSCPSIVWGGVEKPWKVCCMSVRVHVCLLFTSSKLKQCLIYNPYNFFFPNRYSKISLQIPLKNFFHRIMMVYVESQVFNSYQSIPSIYLLIQTKFFPCYFIIHRRGRGCSLPLISAELQILCWFWNRSMGAIIRKSQWLKAEN